MRLSCALIATGLVTALIALSTDAHAETCIYQSEADPHSRLWFEEDGTLVTERLGERVRYPTSTGAGTGIMMRIYHPEDTTLPAASVLVYDLTGIARRDAPQSIVFAFANVYLPDC